VRSQFRFSLLTCFSDFDSLLKKHRVEPQVLRFTRGMQSHHKIVFIRLQSGVRRSDMTWKSARIFLTPRIWATEGHFVGALSRL
jgi:hypothetical protein